jgi:signal transduction histidine kinase
MKLIAIIFCLVSTYAIAGSWEYRVSNNSENLKTAKWMTYPEKNPLKREFEGFVEYRAFFKKSDLVNDSGIYLGKIGDADKTFLNNHQIGQTGNFPPNFSYNMDTERAYFIPQNLIREGQNELRIKVYSKFLVNKGFAPNNFKLAHIKEIDSVRYTSELVNTLSKIAIPILCLVLTAVSFPFLAPKHLWNTQMMLFLIGLSSFILGLCRGRLGYHYFDMLTVYKLTLASSVTTIWLVAMFMTMKCKSSWRYIPTTIATCLVTTITLSPNLISAASWGRVWFHISPLFLLLAIFGNFKSANLMSLRSLGLMVLLVTNMNDNLNDLRIISTTSLLQFGLGTFISLMILDQLLGLKHSWEKYFMKEAQLEIDAELGRQAIQIAHDLRSPIEAISESINRIPEVQKEDEQNLRAGLKRMNEICESLLNKNATKSENLRINQINAAIQVVIKEIKAINPTAQIQVALESLTPPNKQFNFDLSKLQRSLSNLITNALEAADCDCEVVVTSIATEAGIQISIQDNGIGVPTETSKLFERGFTTKLSGNGLGLSSAKLFIESIGGNISIENLPKGSLVTLFIPSNDKAVDFHNLSEPSPAIVLIDDDPLVRFNWKRQGQISKLNVHTFSNFDEFFIHRSSYKLNTPIYIDSQLGDQKGEILSESLAKHGFHCVYLTTGLPENSITTTKWINAIVGKSFESAVLNRHLLKSN